MNCSLPEAYLLDYVDRALSAAKRSEVEAHLGTCTACRAEVALLSEVDQQLRIECGLVKQALEMPSRMANLQSRLVEALQRLSPQEHAGVHERLWRVRFVLALLCGSNTALRMIQAAESSTNVSTLTKPSEQKWLLLLRRVSSLTTEVCGCSAGELIWAVGRK